MARKVQAKFEMWRRPGVRKWRFRAGLVQARCKVQGRFRRFRVVWCRPGVRFKEGSGGFGVVWTSRQILDLQRLAVGDTA